MVETLEHSWPNKIIKANSFISSMLESPLRKNKHSYPIDFSTKKKQNEKISPIKYDVVNFDDVNPEKKIDHKGSVVLSGSSVSELFIETNKKPEEKNDSDYTASREAHTSASNPSENHIKLNEFQKDNLSFPQSEEPLKEIKKNGNKIIIDETKLKSPKIQINEEVTIVTNEMTLEPVTPQKTSRSEKLKEIGSIQRQNFQYFEKFEDEKQIPLHPEKPFNLINKNIRRNSLLEKINLTKSQEKSKEVENYLNSLRNQEKKVFHPETYTYANRFIASSEDKFEKIEKITRNVSFEETKKKDNIIFVNSKNLGSLNFHLRNVPLVKDASFSKSNQQDPLPSKMKNSAFSSFGNSFSAKSEEESGIMFEPNQITALKNQINLIAKNRLKNRSDQSGKVSQTERQFTFQGSEKNKEVTKKGHNDFGKLKQVIKKPTKKLEITYHVPLAKLKGICRTYLASPNIYSLAFKVPKIFMQEDLFRKNQSKDEVHENGLLLFESLKISSKDLVIKRYSNCLMFIAGTVVVIWYYNGKRYLGGWQYEYLDEGSRHGLGLEWEPDVFIYYGEFKNNKRHGLGMMKEGPEKVTVGHWNQGKFKGNHEKSPEEHEFDESYNAEIQEEPAEHENSYDNGHYYEYDER